VVVTFTASLHQTGMRLRCALFLALAALGTSVACGSRQSEEQRHRDANTPAGKVGQAAHKAAVEAGKASRAIGRKLDKAARDAHAGWKEAARKDQDKK
jgi:hypothetical protein